VESLVERTVDELGRVDIVVNNAGGSYLFPLEETPLSKWDNSFALNVRGPFVMTQAAGRHMLAQGSGVFVNISSAAGLRGVNGGVAYSAAKAALQMLTRVVAMEWGGRGIRANCIAVGAVASEGALRSWERAGILDDLIENAGQPIDIANAILYLASDATRFMNGETIALTGQPL
jgi:NAD(P)-dependent dehydrogenase (short-subunit alcohol dehydrogenase family)